jgi:hypothetical protein
MGVLVRVHVAALAAAAALAVPAVASAAAPYSVPEAAGQVSTQAGLVNGLTVVDLNGDGRDDLLAIRGTPQGDRGVPVVAMLDDGHGRFADATSALFNGAPPSPEIGREAVVADYNGAERPDAPPARVPHPAFVSESRPREDRHDRRLQALRGCGDHLRRPARAARRAARAQFVWRRRVRRARVSAARATCSCAAAPSYGQVSPARTASASAAGPARTAFRVIR